MKLKSWLAILMGLLLLSAGAQSKKKLPREKDFAAYLMVYFKDDTHSLHMALSKDGYRFTDVNGGRPVIAGDTIAEQKGVRDPYIVRGPDNQFYMAATDLHIFAQQKGYRTTEWERDGKAFGWGNNRGLVLLKSPDLVHWSHTVLRVDKAFAGLDSIGCAWAPEMLYDATQRKMMLYLTMRFGNGLNTLYYAYTNAAFTQLETAPKPLFRYPKAVSTIDGDITLVGDTFHLFYVPHDGEPGIKQARSTSIHSGYQYDSAWCDPEPRACEAPTVFKRLHRNKWVLVYDIYSIHPHNFGFSETTDFVHFTNLGHFNEGVMKATNFSSPKHSSFIPLTRKEARRLATFWKLDMQF